MMLHVLGDDGTLDTVVVCTGCGRESRYTFDCDLNGPHIGCYEIFTEWAPKDAAEEHECET